MILTFNRQEIPLEECRRRIAHSGESSHRNSSFSPHHGSLAEGDADSLGGSEKAVRDRVTHFSRAVGKPAAFCVLKGVSRRFAVGQGASFGFRPRGRLSQMFRHGQVAEFSTCASAWNVAEA